MLKFAFGCNLHKMKQFEVKALVKECSYEELDDERRELVDKAKEATRNSYAPYSKFHVGAAILLENGKIVTGSNQENIAFPSGMCAERTAAFYASSANPGVAFKKLAVAAWSASRDCSDWEKCFQDTPISPCGGCRQALIEYERINGPIEVILYGQTKTFILPSISALLPLGFIDF